MKLFIKLGIVLGILITIVACQKEDLALSSVASSDQVSLDATNGTDALWTPPNGVEPQVPTPNEDEWSNTGTSIDPPFNSISDEERLSYDLNENLVGSNWSETVTINWVDKMPTGDKWIFVDTSTRGRKAIEGPVPACPYEDCSTAIPAAVAHYQPLANQLCQDIWVCIPCCMGDGIVYATLIIEHNCGIVDLPVSAY